MKHQEKKSKQEFGVLHNNCMTIIDQEEMFLELAFHGIEKKKRKVLDNVRINGRKHILGK